MIPKQDPATSGPIVQAFTAAAVMLPGLVGSSSVEATENGVSFQYGRYEEGKRQLFNVPNNLDPIRVDSIQGTGSFKISDRFKFDFKYMQDTWGGATPVATAPTVYEGNKALVNGGVTTGASPIVRRSLGQVFVDRNFVPVIRDGTLDRNGIELYGQRPQIVHTLSVASPETRKQGDFSLEYELDNAALSLGGGISTERDYESRYANIGTRFDFNRKMTSIDIGLSYTNSKIRSIIDHDLTPYVDQTAYLATNEIQSFPIGDGSNARILNSDREDWATNLGVTQVVGRQTLLQFGLNYTRSTGYMANPYKVVEAIFVNPNQAPDLVNFFGDGLDYFSDGRPGNVLVAQMVPFLEKRPDERNIWTASARFVQFISPLDAAIHVDHKFSADDWGIHAFTLSADWVQPLGSGWTITPRMRYYTQTAADFYSPYLMVKQSYNALSGTEYTKLPENYSSDHRLSGYGAISGGINIEKKLNKAVRLEAGFEYYTHKGALKLGGGGEGSYADFDYWAVSGALHVDLDAASNFGGGSGDEHMHHHHRDHGPPIPAGVMFAHTLHQAGDYMFGYRYMYSKQAGDMLGGDRLALDPIIVNQGCGVAPVDKCFLAPRSMEMHMHMLDIMYAPTDWLTLMLMPQFMDMNMQMRPLDGAPVATDLIQANEPGSDKLRHIPHHLSAGHSTGGIGDTGMYALFTLLGTPNHHMNLTLGVTAPTGAVDIEIRRNHQVDGGLLHFGMQLGSGTWDFKPALTYTGRYNDFSWGGQVSGTKRIDTYNETGFAFGDIFQATGWASYTFTNWLSASVRGVYTTQGEIQGDSNRLIQRLMPADYPKNYGGKYWDVGFGLNASFKDGAFAGHTVSVEWLQPVDTKQNGFQLDRAGALSATWGYMF